MYAFLLMLTLSCFYVVDNLLHPHQTELCLQRVWKKKVIFFLKKKIPLALLFLWLNFTACLARVDYITIPFIAFQTPSCPIHEVYFIKD